MIDIRDLVKHYDRGLVEALNGVSFSIAKGEFVALMGPSGCGKSTLFNLIGALDQPTSGEVRVEGRPVPSITPLHHFRAKTIGFVFQFHHLIPTLTLLENVELPMYTLPLRTRARRDRALAVLAAMGLAQRAVFLPTRVSGGERQRAAVARALVNEPRILLADEPTGSVDSETGLRILELLVGRCREHGTTLLLATHNPEIAAAADRIVYLKNGRLQVPVPYSTCTRTVSHQAGFGLSSAGSSSRTT